MKKKLFMLFYQLADPKRSAASIGTVSRLRLMCLLLLAALVWVYFYVYSIKSTLTAKSVENEFLTYKIEAIEAQLNENKSKKNKLQLIVHDALRNGLASDSQNTQKKINDEKTIQAIADTASDATIRRIFAKYYGRQLDHQ
jgi:hypothetical protein